MVVLWCLQASLWRENRCVFAAALELKIGVNEDRFCNCFAAFFGQLLL